MMLNVNKLPAEHNDDEGVGDEGDEYEGGHDEPVDGLHHIEGAEPVASVQTVARACLNTPRYKLVCIV